MIANPQNETNDSFLKRLFTRIGLIKPPETTEDIEQEIQDILDDGEEQGLITPEEGQMIASILEFKDTIVREVMTPRPEMVCAEAQTSVEQVITLINDKGFTRIPVYSESLDTIIGILHAKDLLIYFSTEETLPSLAEISKPAYHVLETKKIVDLLKEFQKQKAHMAIVTDEFGSVRGLVTLEDILEEIVGEISDEYDKNERTWKVIDQDTLLVNGRIIIEEIEEFFDVKLPPGPYESVGGLILQQLDRVPETGHKTVIGSLSFQVVSASKRRIKTVKIRRQKSK